MNGNSMMMSQTICLRGYSKYKVSKTPSVFTHIYFIFFISSPSINTIDTVWLEVEGQSWKKSKHNLVFSVHL